MQALLLSARARHSPRTMRGWSRCQQCVCDERRVAYVHYAPPDTPRGTYEYQQLHLCIVCSRRRAV
jgi:hypothetical protein